MASQLAMVPAAAAAATATVATPADVCRVTEAEILAEQKRVRAAQAAAAHAELIAPPPVRYYAVVIKHIDNYREGGGSWEETTEHFQTMVEARTYLIPRLRAWVEKKARGDNGDDAIKKNDWRRWCDPDREGYRDRIKAPFATHLGCLEEEVGPYNEPGEYNFTIEWRIDEAKVRSSAVPRVDPLYLLFFPLMVQLRVDAGRERIPNVLLDLIWRIHQAMPSDEEDYDEEDIPQSPYHSEEEEERETCGPPAKKARLA